MVPRHAPSLCNIWQFRSSLLPGIWPSHTRPSKCFSSHWNRNRNFAGRLPKMQLGIINFVFSIWSTCFLFMKRKKQENCIFLLSARLHKWFLLQQLDPIFVALTLQLKTRTCKLRAISIWFHCDLPRNHKSLGTCCNLKCYKSLHRVAVIKILVPFFATNQKKIATTEIGCLAFSRPYCFPRFATGGHTNYRRFDWLVWLRIVAIGCHYCWFWIWTKYSKQIFSNYLTFSFFVFAFWSQWKNTTNSKNGLMVRQNCVIRRTAERLRRTSQDGPWNTQTITTNLFWKRLALVFCFAAGTALCPMVWRLLWGQAISDKGKRLTNVLVKLKRQ